MFPKTHEKTQSSSKILKKLKPKFQKKPSKTSNSSRDELAENCPKKAWMKPLPLSSKGNSPKKRASLCPSMHSHR